MALQKLWRINNVTDEAVSAVAQYLLKENKLFLFEYGGKPYRLCVEEVDNG